MIHLREHVLFQDHHNQLDGPDNPKLSAVGQLGLGVGVVGQLPRAVRCDGPSRTIFFFFVKKTVHVTGTKLVPAV